MYEKAALLHGHSLDEGNSRVANRQYDVLERLRKELQGRGHEGRAVILHLLASRERWIRLVAAGDSLRFEPKQALPVLEELAATPTGACSLTAEITLDAWRNGKLTFEDS